MKLLSLIMIVRDEAALLPGFFKTHRGLFDEMVVVDTGSTDGSQRLIQDAGAILITHPWQADFSAARNRGLEQAQGRWLMVLDADEKLAQGHISSLRGFLAKAPDAVYQQPTINYFPNQNHLEWQPVSGHYPEEEKYQSGFFLATRAGLFPRTKGLRFSGCVHESILPAAEKLGLPTFSLDIPIHHYGFVLSPEKNQKRKSLYRELADKKLAANPQDWAALWEKAAIALEDDEPALALELLTKLILGPDQLPPVNRGRFLLARIHLEQGDQETARQLLHRAQQADPEHLFALLTLLKLEAGSGHWTVVSDLLEGAENTFGPSEPLVMKEKLLFLVRTGQIPAAAQTAQELATRCPQWSEIQTLAKKIRTLAESGTSD